MATAIITEAGDAICANLVSGLGGTIPKYLAWGTGSTAFSKSSTALSAEATTTNDPGYARATATVTLSTTTYTNDTDNFVGTLTAGAAITITEAALFDALTVGNCFEGASFTGVALATNDSIQFTFQTVFD
ncbi:MAG: hypothetical protein GJU73_12565 [Ferrovum sp.]|jgi:L-serine deaminase|uniref:hypothetical protein n=1 Tax=Ferrovum sp. TaxID=2609467 RepID=UPI002637356B|nr:hypothetical protein [Ferrovum sp.]MBW8068256.1 hypothetical protein [Ferrovum sp.]